MTTRTSGWLRALAVLAAVSGVAVLAALWLLANLPLDHATFVVDGREIAWRGFDAPQAALAVLLVAVALIVGALVVSLIVVLALFAACLGIAIASLADAKAALTALQAMGPRCVLLTSFESRPGHIGMVAAEGGDFWHLETPLLPLSVNGAGDAICALFLLHRMRTGSAAAALSAAASSVFGLLKRTAEAGSLELVTVAAQDEFVMPSQSFSAEPV